MTIAVSRAMLQLLALQHELEEPLILNGDTFDRGGHQTVGRGGDTRRCVQCFLRQSQITKSTGTKRRSTSLLGISLASTESSTPRSDRQHICVSIHGRVDGPALRSRSPQTPRNMQSRANHEVKFAAGWTMMKTFLQQSDKRRCAEPDREGKSHAPENRRPRRGWYTIFLDGSDNYLISDATNVAVCKLKFESAGINSKCIKKQSFMVLYNHCT